MLLGFIDIARVATCFFISNALLQTYDAYASLRRIEDFLLLENLPATSRGQSKEDISNTGSKTTKVTSGLLDRQAKIDIAFNPRKKSAEQAQHFICVESDVPTD